MRPPAARPPRVEALNIFNRVPFGAPERSMTSASFGVITSQANDPRQLQFGLKLFWQGRSRPGSGPIGFRAPAPP